jgi:hypothetical protein
MPGILAFKKVIKNPVMGISYSDLNLTKRKYSLYLESVLRVNLSFRQPFF